MLEELPIASAQNLLTPSTFEEANTSKVRHNIHVSPIDPIYKGGDDFCHHYKVPPEHGANCIVLQASRGDKKWFVATLVPVGCKMDIGGYVRRTVNARKLSVAPLQEVLDATQMEYGSITVVGLPDDWDILIDSRIAEKDYVFIGSGKVQSKLKVPGAFFKNPRYQLIKDLGLPN